MALPVSIGRLYFLVVSKLKLASSPKEGSRTRASSEITFDKGRTKLELKGT